MRRWVDFLGESVIKASGYAGALAVVAIIFFLFKEGVGLFGRSPVEGFEIAVHPANPVEKLTEAQVHDLLSGKIVRWDLWGGRDTVELWHVSNLDKKLKSAGIPLMSVYGRFPEFFDSLLRARPGTMLIFQRSLLPSSAKRVAVEDIGLAGFLTGKNWKPTESPAPFFGAWPLIGGTLLVTLYAMIFAVVLGVPTAVYLAEPAPKKIRAAVKPMIELLSGVPSVVFGFIGLVVVVPGLRAAFGLDSGSTALAGSMLLAVVALPTIVSVAEDAIRAVPDSLRHGALALGATHWQVIYRVVVPHARSGIAAALILGAGRIVGETMVVLMVTGNNPQWLGWNPLQSVRTMSAAIAAEMGEAPQGGVHYQSLFTVGCLLFILTFFVNFVGELLKSKVRK
jgi:phosphate transport system permease protein